MSICSFLSIGGNEIDCFGDCAFYNWEENGGVCPFKNLKNNRASRLKELSEYDFFGEHGINIKEIDQYYMEKDYI
ncbi:hypothetical protein M2651_09795 [Clostridium sp. SYSU_GA19001]|uniref:hypothetical protein n=1 Tax=Clostridium caldaquaticum TaxID=2940653 RepID=UPI002076ED9F|nr:hypothetical protein [Clostridium caldaquaticum]MCM8711323.1 hypothetical protein [Clostridium caldaquaticum]